MNDAIDFEGGAETKICPCIFIAPAAAVIALALMVQGAGKPAGKADARNSCGITCQIPKDANMTEKVVKPDSEWKKILSPLQYMVMRKKETERAFTGKYYNFKGKGEYVCAGCGKVLFSSDAKYDSGSGWPSFWQPMEANSVATSVDRSGGMVRTEALCSRCRAHLGHVLNDGPQPTGLRYCINSASLDFTGDPNVQQPPDVNK